MRNNMKKPMIITAMCVCAVLSSLAQHELTRQGNMMRNGDYLYKQQIPFMPAGERGENLLWECPTEVSADRTYRQDCGVVEDSLVSIEHGSLYFYKMHSDSLMCTGFENRTTRMQSLLARCELIYPFSYGDSIFGYYAMRGLYGERLHMSMSGYSYTTADAKGRMVLGEDTLDNVLRVHRYGEYVQKVGKDALSMDISQEDSVKALLERDTLNVKYEDVYRWYVWGYRYPVMESYESGRIRQGEKELLFATAFRYAPMDQAYDLPCDSVNEAIREQQTMPASQEMQEESFPIIMTARVTEDKTGLQLHYELQQTCSITFRVYDAAGRLVGILNKGQTQSGFYEELLNFVSPPLGDAVVLQMKADEQEEIMKISINRQ